MLPPRATPQYGPFIDACLPPVAFILQVRTRAVTLSSFVSSAAAMLPPILKLLRAELPVEIRLMGVRGSNLRKAPQRLDQLAAEGKKLNALERMVLQARQKERQEQGREGQQQQQEGQDEQGYVQAQPQGQMQAQWLQEDAHHEQDSWQQQQQARTGQPLEWGRNSCEQGAGSDGDADGDGAHSQGELLLRAIWCLPTQEELQADYEQQCRQQEQQALDAADIIDACEGGEEGWEHQQRHIVRGGPQGAAAGLPKQGWGLPDPQQQQQQSKAHAALLPLPQQQQAGRDVEEDKHAPASKRQRCSFHHPAQDVQHAHVLAATAATGAAEGPNPAEQQHEQHEQQQLSYQKQQQPQGVPEAAAGWEEQQSCWQKASDLQQQDHVLSHEHNVRQQQCQQQEQQQVPQPEDVLFGVEVYDPGQHSVATAAAAATAAQAQNTKPDRGGASSSRKSAGGPWSCLACTFSGNDQKWLRCSVCETPKGDTEPQQTMLGPGGSHSSNTSRVTAAAGRGGGRGGAGGSSRQLTLEHLGLRKQRKR